MEAGMLMIRDVHCIHPDTPVLETARLMRINDIGVLPVARAHDAMTRRVRPFSFAGVCLRRPSPKRFPHPS